MTGGAKVISLETPHTWFFRIVGLSKLCHPFLDRSVILNFAGELCGWGKWPKLGE